MVVARRPPKMNALMGTAGGIFPCRVNGGALRRRRGKARIWVRRFHSRFLGDLRRPDISAPVDTLCRRLVRHALPPDSPFGRQRDIGENPCCARAWTLHSGWSDLTSRERHRKTRLGVDCSKSPVGVRPDPSNVIADGPHLPAVETFGRNEHGEICFAAGAGKSRRDIGLFARGRDLLRPR